MCAVRCLLLLQQRCPRDLPRSLLLPLGICQRDSVSSRESQQRCWRVIEFYVPSVPKGIILQRGLNVADLV